MVVVVLVIVCYIFEDECVGFVDVVLMVCELFELDFYYLWSLSFEQVVECVLVCEVVVFVVDKWVIKVDGIILNIYQGCWVYGNSYGFIGGYVSIWYSFSCVMIVEGEGQMQCDYWYDVNCCGEVLVSVELIGWCVVECVVS